MYFSFQEQQVAMVRELLFNGGDQNLNNETIEKLQFLNKTKKNGQNSTLMKDHLQNRSIK